MSLSDLPPHEPTNPTPGKNERSYRLDGLASRDVLIFKSMVRLLSHRTDHMWAYLPHSTELRVIAEGSLALADPSKHTQQALTLGTANVKRHMYLQMPLHANELEAALNQVGSMITPTSQLAGVLVSEPAGMAPMRMLRWPPAALLTTAPRIRLATLMAGKPLTIAELQQRSNENIAVCTAFFEDLKQLGLLVPAGSVRPLSTAPTKSAVITAPQRVKKSPVQPSLIERIRMRLGLQVSSPSG